MLQAMPTVEEFVKRCTALRSSADTEAQGGTLRRETTNQEANPPQREPMARRNRTGCRSTETNIKLGERVKVTSGDYCVGEKATLLYYCRSYHGSEGGLFKMDNPPEWQVGGAIWLPLEDVTKLSPRHEPNYERTEGP